MRSAWRNGAMAWRMARAPGRLREHCWRRWLRRWLGKVTNSWEKKDSKARRRWGGNTSASDRSMGCGSRHEAAVGRRGLDGLLDTVGGRSGASCGELLLSRFLRNASRGMREGPEGRRTSGGGEGGGGAGGGGGGGLEG